MTIFKMGMRVKRVRNPKEMPASETTLPIGATGMVVPSRALFSGEGYVWVMPDNPPAAYFMNPVWGCKPETLEPILGQDDKADEFINRLKKLGQEPVIAPPQPVRTDS